MQKEELKKTLEEAKRFFTRERFSTSLSLASLLLEQGNFTACEDILSRLPTRDVLFKELVAKLKGKSIFRTLKKIHESEVDSLTKVKGLSSLVTHCIIEMQAGSPEYGMLLPDLLHGQRELISELSLGVGTVGMSLAKKVNRILKKASLIPFDEEELTSAIEGFSENAVAALKDAIRDRDVNKIFNILGMKEITGYNK